LDIVSDTENESDIQSDSDDERILSIEEIKVKKKLLEKRLKTLENSFTRCFGYTKQRKRCKRTTNNDNIPQCVSSIEQTGCCRTHLAGARRKQVTF
jgi:hypothetical protein